MYSYIGLTEHIDLALISLYVFWAFFAGLVYYLQREMKREGYPLVEEDRGRRVSIVGFPNLPSPKSYALQGGHTSFLPSGRDEGREIRIASTAGFSGAPYAPTGNAIADGVGPGSWAQRSDHPDLTIEGGPKIVPLRAAPGFYLAEEDPNPVGWPVIGGDRKVAGTVSDVWVDQSEYLMRYFEVTLPDGQQVLAPATFCSIDGKRGRIVVKALYAANFAGIPKTRTPDQVTLLEEDMIVGYFGGGTFYAHPGRPEPLL